MGMMLAVEPGLAHGTAESLHHEAEADPEGHDPTLESWSVALNYLTIPLIYF